VASAAPASSGEPGSTPGSASSSSAVTGRPRSCCTAWRSRPRSAARACRCTGSRAIARASTVRSRSGTSSRVSGEGVPRSIRPTRSAASLPPPGRSKGERPASAENSVAASEYTSERSSPCGCAASSSGAAHGIDMPTAAPSASRGDAMPKSDSTGRPKSLVSTLPGLMSRCTIPARCTVSTAAASRTPVSSTSATVNRSERYRWPSPGREQYSSTRYGRPSSATPAWNTDTIDGWCATRAIRSASRAKASRVAGSTESSSTFTATARRGSSWSYRNTSAAPPPPSSRCGVYPGIRGGREGSRRWFTHRAPR
jgi:hypothetical protein